MTAILFTTSPEETDDILKIVNRASELANKLQGRAISRMDLTMDLAAVHANGNPMNFAGLLAADDTSFIHDIGGIMRHLDRNTGVLRDCFSPRYSKPEVLKVYVYQDGRHFFRDEAATMGGLMRTAPFKVKDGDRVAAIEARAAFHTWCAAQSPAIQAVF